jgi:hypothetical protein
MTRLVALLMIVSGLMLAIGCARAVVRMADQGPVYSVAELRAHLAHDPGAWARRTVLVRGRATACAIRLEQGHFHCTPRQPRLDDPDGAAMTEPLPLSWAGPNPALTVMRGIPLLGSLLPGPQELDWDVVATYRVQLRAVANRRCGATACYEALVLDATP